jgi:hypothetical protein
MQVTKVSPFTGKENTLEIPLTDAEFRHGCELYRAGALIQEAFPGLSAGLREFLLTGITPEEWEREMKEPEDVVAYVDALPEEDQDGMEAETE